MKDLSKVSGGIARSQKLTKEQKSSIAKKAASKRWDSSIVQASHQGILHIADKNIDCVVTETGHRILNIKNVFEAFGRTPRGYKKINREIIMPPFMDALNLRPYISEELQKLMIPIEYKDINGKILRGYRAEILPEICLTYLKAHGAGILTKKQEDMVKMSHILIGAFSTVGIIALVDEATGYQQDRIKDALSKILQAYISEALQPWVSTIPADYYRELFRLKGLEYNPQSVKRPRYFGHITNDIIYSRLALGVLEELKKISPRDNKGRLKHKYFQRLTENTGYIKLKERLASIVSIMKLSQDYNDFKEKLDRIHPVCTINDQGLDDKFENDSNDSSL